MTVYQKIP